MLNSDSSKFSWLFHSLCQFNQYQLLTIGHIWAIFDIDRSNWEDCIKKPWIGKDSPYLLWLQLPPFICAQNTYYKNERLQGLWILGSSKHHSDQNYAMLWDASKLFLVFRLDLHLFAFCFRQSLFFWQASVKIIL